MSEETKAELPPPSFRKTKTGKWAVMAPVVTLEAALAADGKVEVLKKSGDWSDFTVGSLGGPFDVDGVSMCYGYAPGDEYDPDAPRQDSGGNGGGGGGGGSERGSAPGRDYTPQRSQERPPSGGSIAGAPPVDESEPLPEYMGEDDWSEG